MNIYIYISYLIISFYINFIDKSSKKKWNMDIIRYTKMDINKISINKI